VSLHQASDSNLRWKIRSRPTSLRLRPRASSSPPCPPTPSTRLSPHRRLSLNLRRRSALRIALQSLGCSRTAVILPLARPTLSPSVPSLLPQPVISATPTPPTPVDRVCTSAPPRTLRTSRRRLCTALRRSAVEAAASTCPAAITSTVPATTTRTAPRPLRRTWRGVRRRVGRRRRDR
jgi:hypothetical protein